MEKKIINDALQYLKSKNISNKALIKYRYPILVSNILLNIKTNVRHLK